MIEVHVEGVQDEAEGDFCPDASGGTIAPDCNQYFSTPWASSCPVATRYNLTPQYSIPTTVCSAVVRESQCGRVWQFLGAYNRGNHIVSMAMTGFLNSHTVWSRSGRSSTQVIPIARAIMSVLSGTRTRRGGSLACAPVT